MESYRRVKKPKPKPELPLSENEVRITTQGSIRKYLNYVTTQLQDKQVSEIVLKAMGQAIIKTVAIAEIIKRKVLYTLELNIITNRRQFNEYWDFVQFFILNFFVTPADLRLGISNLAISGNAINQQKGMASATPAAMSRKQKVFARLRQENEGRRVGKSNPTITVNPTDQQEDLRIGMSNLEISGNPIDQQEGVETSEREWMDEGGRRRPLPLFMQRHREAIRKRTERQLEILNPRGPPEGLPPERLWAFTF